MSLERMLKEMKERIERDNAESLKLIQPEKRWLRDLAERERLIAALEKCVEQRNSWLKIADKYQVLDGLHGDIYTAQDNELTAIMQGDGE